MKILTKIKELLLEYDFIWSIPIAFSVFMLFPIIGQQYFGDDFAFYPPSFFHAGIYAALLIVLFNSVVQMGILINFPTMYEYYLKSFSTLPEWQKLIAFSFYYVFFFSSLIIVWRTIV